METDFEKASSDNLPIVDSEMVNDFYMSNLNFVSTEVKNVKTKRSAKESYGDNAVGYVQIKRDRSICVVREKITPEHRIHNKAYTVEVVVDENEEKVLSCECKDCAASEDFRWVQTWCCISFMDA